MDNEVQKVFKCANCNVPVLPTFYYQGDLAENDEYGGGVEPKEVVITWECQNRQCSRYGQKQPHEKALQGFVVNPYYDLDAFIEEHIIKEIQRNFEEMKKMVDAGKLYNLGVKIGTICEKCETCQAAKEYGLDELFISSIFKERLKK